MGHGYCNDLYTGWDGFYGSAYGFCWFQVLVIGATVDKSTTLTPEQLHLIDAYWRATNYLSVGQIYLCDNILFKRSLALSDVKSILIWRENLEKKEL